jgi:hypothetical protein
MHFEKQLILRKYYGKVGSVIIVYPENKQFASACSCYYVDI